MRMYKERMEAVAVHRWRMLVVYVMRINRFHIYPSRIDRITYDRGEYGGCDAGRFVPVGGP